MALPKAPTGDARQVEQPKQARQQQHLQGLRFAGQKGADGGHRHDPGLGVDPLERGRGPKSHGRGRSCRVGWGGGGVGQLPGQPQQVGRADPAHGAVDQREALQHGVQAQAHQQVIKPNPRLMPNRWRSERRKPKLTPEARIIMLFGPGVMELTTANRLAASSRSWS